MRWVWVDAASSTSTGKYNLGSLTVASFRLTNSPRQSHSPASTGSTSTRCNLGLDSSPRASTTNSPKQSATSTRRNWGQTNLRTVCSSSLTSPGGATGSTRTALNESPGQRFCRRFAASDPSPNRSQQNPLESASRRADWEASQDYSNQEAGGALRQAAGKGFG